jgi:hypothetical protein
MDLHRRHYKEDYKNCPNTKLLFDKYGVENCKIKIFEDYPCDNELELRQRENHWIKQLIKDPNCMNAKMAFRSFEEKWK